MLTSPAPRAPTSAAALPPPGVGCPAASCCEKSSTLRSPITGAALITERSERSGVRRRQGLRNRLQPVGLGPLKHRSDLGGRAGASEEEALGPLAAEPAQRVHLGLGLHSLGHHANVKR